MDYRRKNQRQKSHVSNSMAEFPKQFSPRQYNGLISPNQKDSSFQNGFGLPSLREKQNVNTRLHIRNLLEPLDQRAETIQNSLYFKNGKIEFSPQSQSSVNPHSSPNFFDFSLLKQKFQKDLLTQNEQICKQSVKYEQLQLRQNRMEQRLSQWLNEQNSNTNIELMNQREEIRGQQQLKQMRFNNKIETLTNNLATLEKHYAEERQKNIKHDAVFKQSLHRQIGLTKQQIISLIKDQRQKSEKWLKQLRQSFNMLKTIIEIDRSQVKEAITHIQHSSDSNISKISTNIENINHLSTQKGSTVDKKIGNFKNQWKHFQQTIQQKLEANKSILMNLQNNSLNFMQQQERHQSNLQMLQLKQEVKQWKKHANQKNFSIFKQLLNGMKSMRNEWKQEQQQFHRHIQQVSKSVKHLKSNITQQLKHNIQQQLKHNIQQITHIIGDQFDIFTYELDQTSALVALAKNQTDQKIQKILSSQISPLKSLINTVTATASKSLEEAKNNLIALSLNCTNTMEEHFKQTKSHLQLLETTTQTKLDKFIESLNRENQEWASNINKAITNVKQSLSDQIQVSSENHTKKLDEESKRLEEKFATNTLQLNTKIEQTNDNFKKQIKTHLENQRNQTAKQLSKTKEQIMKIILQQKEKQRIEKEYLETAFKETDRKIEAVASSLKTDVLAQLQNNKRANQLQAKAKEQQLKSKMIELQKRFIESMGKVKSEIVNEVTKSKTAQTQELRILKSQMNLQIQQIKAKDSQMKTKAAQMEKKMVDSITNLKSDVMLEMEKSKESVSANIKQVENRFNDLNSKYLGLHNQNADMKLFVQKSTTQTKESLNKLEANSFIDRENYKTMYDTFSKDIIDITDGISALMSQMKIK